MDGCASAAMNVFVEDGDSSSVIDSSDSSVDEYSDISDSEKEAADDGTESALAVSTSSVDEFAITQQLKEVLNTPNNMPALGNIKVENSTNVHIGNVTNINGKIKIIHISSGDSRHRASDHKRNVRRKEKKTSGTSPTATSNEDKKEGKRPEKHHDGIITRQTWLAFRPTDDYTYLEEPAKYVVIAHTVTDSSEKQAQNMQIVKDIQSFHIGTCDYGDIGYNFLIGCDGNVYEGRGWRVVGAHTKGYNTRSLGIAFIGCFMRVLPSQAALNACKKLLKRGVDDDHLDANYRLIGHSQCYATESPGRKLFAELQTWPHFDESPI